MSLLLHVPLQSLLHRQMWVHRYMIEFLLLSFLLVLYSEILNNIDIYNIIGAFLCGNAEGTSHFSDILGLLQTQTQYTISIIVP